MRGSTGLLFFFFRLFSTQLSSIWENDRQKVYFSIILFIFLQDNVKADLSIKKFSTAVDFTDERRALRSRLSFVRIRISDVFEHSFYLTGRVEIRGFI